MNNIFKDIYNRHDNILHLIIEALMVGILVILIESKISHITK